MLIRFALGFLLTYDTQIAFMRLRFADIYDAFQCTSRFRDKLKNDIADAKAECAIAAKKAAEARELHDKARNRVAQAQAALKTAQAIAKQKVHDTDTTELLIDTGLKPSGILHRPPFSSKKKGEQKDTPEQKAIRLDEKLRVRKHDRAARALSKTKEKHTAKVAKLPKNSLEARALQGAPASASSSSSPSSSSDEETEEFLNALVAKAARQQPTSTTRDFSYDSD